MYIHVKILEKQFYVCANANASCANLHSLTACLRREQTT